MAKRSKFPAFTLLIIVIAVLAVGGYMLFRDFSSPEIALSPEVERVSPTLPLTLTATDEGSGIKSIQVQVRRNNRIIPILKEEYKGVEKKQEVTFNLQETGLRDTFFELEVKVTDSSWAGFGRGNSVTQVYSMRMDSTPPRISIKTSPPYVRQGGAGVIQYSVNKEVSKTGVKVNNLFFKGYQQENGDYVCFFAFPYYMATSDFNPKVMAVDLSGNAKESEVPVFRIKRDFKKESIAVENFLAIKEAEFAELVPDADSDLERFLKINGPMRKQNAETLLEIGKTSSGKVLWKDAFQPLPKAANRAGFADHRTYTWEGKNVDEQTHLGFDYASVRNAEIPAANSGTVIFTGYLGIYGNLVVIDHGLGLQSLYSHMSEINVDTGQNVARGDILGRTGTTGMAVGDHLHFGILVGGLEVTPLEWLDSHWVKDNIADRLKNIGNETEFMSQ